MSAVGTPTFRERCRRWALDTLAVVLLVVGLACFAYLALIVLATRWLDADAARLLDEAEREVAADVRPASASTLEAVEPGTPLGRLEIPDAGIFHIVRAGADENVLRLGIGHIPETAALDSPGNVGLAAHRDGVFRGLRRLRHGDPIRVVTPKGVQNYVVSWTAVVEPEAVSVLEPTAHPSLTLVTCYPFTYFGPAPERFIVRAERMESVGRQ